MSAALPARQPFSLPPLAPPIVHALLAFVLPLALYLAAPARTMNGDGLAYYHLAKSPDWTRKCVPGHLLYAPTLDVVGRAVQAVCPAVTLPQVMLAVNQLAGAGAVCLLFLSMRRLGLSHLACWLAALGLTVSFGFWMQAADVEAYALTLLFLLAGLYCMCRLATGDGVGWAVALGACNAGAGLFHLATVTFGIACVVLIVASNWGRPRGKGRMLGHLAAYLGTAAVVFAVPLFALGWGVMGVRDLGGLLAWLKSSDHGYRAAFGLSSFPRAAYGFARTFVMLESFWEGPIAFIAAKVIVFGSTAGLLLWVGRRTPMSGPTRSVLLAGGAFAAVQAVLGVYYFGSDSERWVFLAPLVWMLLGIAASRLPTRQRALAFTGVATLAFVNFACGVWPLATDNSAEERVLAFDRATGGNALVITPGHDWLSYYTLYQPEAEGRAEVVSLINLALKHPDNADALLAEVGRRVELARAQGRPVVLVRVLDPRENPQEDPWQGLANLGCPFGKVRDWAKRYEWDTFRLDDTRQTRAWRLRAVDYAVIGH